MQTVTLIAQVNWAPVVWVALGMIAALGLIAIVSPSRFAAIATRGNQWVDSGKYLEVLDRKVDVDQLVLPFSRWLGVAVLASVALLAVLYTRT